MGVSDIVALLGGIALFLYGMSVMGDNLKKVAGSKLEVVLFRLSSTPLKGILLGTGVTAVIQSSSATSVMVVGFVNSGMMKTRQAIGIILGAILGTSITGWILCLGELGGASGVTSLLSTSTLTGMVAVTGVILRMFSKKGSNQKVGNILLGFAVLMYGMSAMSGAVSPLRSSPEFVGLLTRFSNPVLGILLGMLFTAAIQSASAAVGILQALAVTGAVTFDVALPIIMGIGIGAAVPVLLSALGASTGGKRTAAVYLIIDIIGAILCSVFYYGLNAVFHFSVHGQVLTSVTIALVNTLFRLGIVLAEGPMIPLLDRFIAWVFPTDAATLLQEQDMDRLEERFLQHPALAIEQSRMVTNSMAEKARQNLTDAMSLRHSFSEKGLAEVMDLESVIDRYEDKLGTYLMKITRKSLSPAQSDEVSKYLHTISDFERISDHASNIAEVMQELHEKDVQFSKDARWELDIMEAAIKEIITISIDAFVNNDVAQASRVEPLEEVIDGLCDEMKSHHVERLQAGGCTLTQGFIFTDLLTNFERVADHCSNIAVAIIELESDSFDTHEYLKSVREMKDASFAQYYKEYQEKFFI